MNFNVNEIKNASLFFLKKNWPTIATVGGCAGVLAGTVLACRGALKLPDILNEHNDKMDELENWIEEVALQEDECDPEDIPNVGKEKAKST